MRARKHCRPSVFGDMAAEFLGVWLLIRPGFIGRSIKSDGIFLGEAILTPMTTPKQAVFAMCSPLGYTKYSDRRLFLIHTLKESRFHLSPGKVLKKRYYLKD